MRFLRIVPFCVASMIVACNQQGGLGESAGSVDPVVGGATSPIRAGETEAIGTAGPIPVLVVGDAFGLDRGALEQAVTNQMQGAGWANARFVPASQADAQSDRQGYRVVMLLNRGTANEAAAFCRGGATGPAAAGPGPRAAGRDVALSGVLCQNGKDLRQVRTGADDVAGVDDPAFRQMIRQATTELTLSGGEANVFRGSDQDR